MRRIDVYALLLASAAAACAGDEPEPEKPLRLEGVWTIVGHHTPGVAGMSEVDAEDWRGQTLRLTPRRAANLRALLEARRHYERLLESRPAWEVSQGIDCCREGRGT